VGPWRGECHAVDRWEGWESPPRTYPTSPQGPPSGLDWARGPTTLLPLLATPTPSPSPSYGHWEGRAEGHWGKKA